jgi:hypothetical protein
MHESYQPVAGLLSEIIILTDFKRLLLVLAVDKPVCLCCALSGELIRRFAGLEQSFAGNLLNDVI